MVKHSSYRISEDGKQIIKLLAKKLGVTETAILEISVRKFGEMEGVKLEKDAENRSAFNVDRSNS